MNKMPENKTRKGFRVALCTLYLFLMALCALPYIQIQSGDKLVSQTVFAMLFSVTTSSNSSDVTSYAVLYSIFFIIPLIGFFFCALDKYRNLKNIVSLLCCLGGVIALLAIIPMPCFSLGSLLSLLFYIIACVLSTLSMLARVAEPRKKDEEKVKKAD